MTEQTTQTTQTTVDNATAKQQDVNTQQPTQNTEADLITRASQVKLPESQQQTQDEVKFNINDLDKIQDPQARKYAEDAYKSFQQGFNKKFQDLADTRKSLETQRAELQQQTKWTPERIQTLLQNPDFVNAAKEVPGVGQGQEYQTEEEKQRDAEFTQLKKEFLAFKRQNSQITKLQQDETLKTKYANYNSQAIDTITQELLEGKRQATREDLHKVLDYEDGIRRAYELGRQDRKLDTTEKISSVSAEGVQAVGTREVPPQQEKETDQQYFKRLALRNLQKTQTGQT